MTDLNDLNQIKKLDPKDTLASTDLLPQQLQTAWEQVSQVKIPQNYHNIKNIIFCGMGASVYGALVTKSLLGSKFPYPTEVISDYHLPGYAGKDTLVVLTSYSGTTEEVLSCAEDAKQKNAKMLILTGGGQLAEFAKNNDVPAYIFDGALNPAGVPRLGNGYTIVGLLGLLHNAGVIKIDKENLEKAMNNLSSIAKSISEKAKNDSHNYVGRIPIIFSAQHLSGNAQILRNQFNETSKQFSAYYLVPDLNHHLMEGLAFPQDHNLRFISFSSHNYSQKIQERISLTKDVVEKNKHTIDEYRLSGTTIYHDFLEMLTYGSYLTLYLGLLNGQNPAVNPWVDYFKEQLSK